jgi:hypothetical protein
MKATGHTCGPLSVALSSASSGTPLLTDNADLCISTQFSDDIEGVVAHRMQQALDLWGGGIRAPGGAEVSLVPYLSYLAARQWKYATELTLSSRTIMDLRRQPYSWGIIGTRR